MRQALQAEVLEEERRRTIRDRLASKGRKQSRSVKRSKSKRGGDAGDEESTPGTGRRARATSTAGSQNGEDEDDLDEGHIRHQSEIMARHQRALSRRLRAEASGQAQYNVSEVGSPRLAVPASPMSPTGSRFGSLGGTIRRASMLRRTSEAPPPSTGQGHEQQQRPQSQLLQTPQRPKMKRDASVASTIIMHGSPLPAAATPVATSGTFPPLSYSGGRDNEERQGSPSRSAAAGTAEMLEMKDMGKDGHVSK